MKILPGMLLAFAVATPMAAQNASYESTTQLTGGSLVEMVKQLSFLKATRDMLAPISSTTMVRGNQKATISKETTEIVDLDKETIYHLDNVKKTYTAITFTEMRQMMANLPAQMQQAQTQIKQAEAQAPPPPSQMPSNMKVTTDVSVKSTGESKAVNGEMAQEQVITLATHITDTNSPLAPGTNPVTYTMTMDVWLAPKPPEMQAIEDFDVRMAKKLMQGVDMSAMVAQVRGMQRDAQMNLGPLFASQPGAGLAMKQFGEEMSKLKGMALETTMSMGGLAPAGSAVAAQQNAPTTPPPTAGSVAGQVATDAAAQTAANQAGKLGSFGSALGSSALGSFRRKKAAPPAETAPPAAAAAPPAAAAEGVPPGMVNVTLLAMTEEKKNFSTEAPPASAFQIPPGYKPLPSPAR